MVTPARRRRLALPAVEEYRLRSALLGHYREEKDNAGGPYGRYPLVVLQDLRPRWREIERRVTSLIITPHSAGWTRPVDYAELVDLAEEQASEEEDGGPPRDHALSAYLDAVRNAVAKMRLCLGGQPAGWALAAVHGDVRGWSVTPVAFYSWEEVTLTISASPAYGRVIARSADGSTVEDHVVEARELFAFDDWEALTNRASEVAAAQVAKMRETFKNGRPDDPQEPREARRYPYQNRASLELQARDIKALYRCLREKKRYDKLTTDRLRTLTERIRIDLPNP